MATNLTDEQVATLVGTNLFVADRLINAGLYEYAHIVMDMNDLLWNAQRSQDSSTVLATV